MFLRGKFVRTESKRVKELQSTSTLEVQKKVSTPLLFRFQKSTEARLFGPDQDIHTGSSTRLVNNAVEDGEGEKRPNSKNMTNKKKPKKTKDKQH